MNSNISSSQKYKVTFVLVALNVAVYVYTSVAGGSFFRYWGDPLNLGQYNLAVFQGAYYQLFTAMFVNDGILHLAGNMLFLLIFGLRGEEMFSLPEYLGIYIFGGLAGNALSLVLGPSLFSVGASGAIFALLGGCLTYSRRSIGQSVVSALIFGFFLLIIMSTGENTNILAHVGGLAAGLGLGYLFARFHGNPVQYQVRYRYMSPF